MKIELHPNLSTEHLRSCLESHGLRMRWHNGSPRVEKDPKFISSPAKLTGLSPASIAFRVLAIVRDHLVWRCDSLAMEGRDEEIKAIATMTDPNTDRRYEITIRPLDGG